jgi:hypothetical protein
LTDLPAWFDRLRPYLLKALWLAGIAGPLLAVVLAYQLNDWPARRFLLLYLAPLTIAVAWWLALRLKHLESSTQASRLLDICVLATAATRLAGAALPVSGHMLWLTYAWLTTRDTPFRLLATVLLVETTVFKLGIWSDLKSWALGGAIGVVLAGLYWRAPASPLQAT